MMIFFGQATNNPNTGNASDCSCWYRRAVENRRIRSTGLSGGSSSIPDHPVPRSCLHASIPHCAAASGQGAVSTASLLHMMLR